MQQQTEAMNSSQFEVDSNTQFQSNQMFGTISKFLDHRGASANINENYLSFWKITQTLSSALTRSYALASKENTIKSIEKSP